MSLENTRKVIIMRGWPGTGKSTLTAELLQDNGVVCSADAFFIRNGNGVYKYEPGLLRTAHDVCRLEFRNAIFEKEPLIIVDNTNIKREHYKYYVDIATEQGIKCYQLVAPWVNSVRSGLDMSAEACYKRNVHNVPLATIEKMMKEFEHDDRLEHFKLS